MKIKLNTFVLALVCLCFISCSSSDDSEDEIIPEQPVGFKGEYTGTWSSTTPSITYTDYPVSITIEQERVSGNEITLSGPFFATGSNVSCCGNTDDGSVVIEIVDNTITSFSFNDRIEGCTGNFTGSGVVTSNGTLVIDFEGNDCDGDHVGVMRFFK